MERREMNNTIKIIHIATIADETEVGIIFGDGTERIVKVPFDTYASQRLGKYKHENAETSAKNNGVLAFGGK